MRKCILKKLFIIVFVVFCTQIVGFANDKIEISLATGGLGENALQRIGGEELKRIFEEKVGDKAYITIYPDLQLGSDSDIQEMVQMGSIEMFVAASAIVEIAPEMGIFDMPFLFTNREDTFTILDGPIGKQLSKSLEEKGVKHLGYGELGFRCITNNVRPIITPEDLQGLLLRVPANKIRLDVFNTLGANATPLNYSELYVALQQGVVDGQENPLTSIYTAKFYEVQKYLSLSNHVFTPIHVIVNADFYNNLSNDIREALNEASLEGMKITREQGRKNDERILKILEDEDIEINEVDIEAFTKKASLVWEKYEDQYGEYISEILEKTAN